MYFFKQITIKIALELASVNMGKILVIEDEKNIRETISEILVLNGYEVECSNNGRLGLNRALKMHPDLVLCDIMMPEFDGLQTIKAFRQISELSCTPFVFLSALSTMSDFRSGMNLGADDYLSKPFKINELLKVISLQLNKVEERRKLYEFDSKNSVNDLIIKSIENEAEKAKDMQDSLERAKMVQQVILPSNDELNQFLPKHFIYYSPKESISGDFYWARKLDDLAMFAVADCTGHGVPAALISMVCYNMLNTTVDQYGYRNPANILDTVNSLVNEFMSAHHKNYIGDGMDIALCVIDRDRKLIKYAGAKRPVYVVTKDLNAVHVNSNKIRVIEDSSEQKLFEIKGCNSSVGAIGSDFDIHEEIFHYKKGDTIYLTSDGFADQFGGDCDKKYKTKNLKDLILKVQGNGMKKQKKLISDDFEIWKGNTEQTDDVTIFGVRL